MGKSPCEHLECLFLHHFNLVKIDLQLHLERCVFPSILAKSMVYLLIILSQCQMRCNTYHGSVSFDCNIPFHLNFVQYRCIDCC